MGLGVEVLMRILLGRVEVREALSAMERKDKENCSNVSNSMLTDER